MMTAGPHFYSYPKLIAHSPSSHLSLALSLLWGSGLSEGIRGDTQARSRVETLTWVQELLICQALR